MPGSPRIILVRRLLLVSLSPPTSVFFLLGSSGRLAVLRQKETGPVFLFFVVGGGKKQFLGFSPRFLSPDPLLIGWIVETSMRPVSASQSSISTFFLLNGWCFGIPREFLPTHARPLFSYQGKASQRRLLVNRNTSIMLLVVVYCTMSEEACPTTLFGSYDGGIPCIFILLHFLIGLLFFLLRTPEFSETFQRFSQYVIFFWLTFNVMAAVSLLCSDSMRWLYFTKGLRWFPLHGKPSAIHRLGLALPPPKYPQYHPTFADNRAAVNWVPGMLHSAKCRSGIASGLRKPALPKYYRPSLCKVFNPPNSCQGLRKSWEGLCLTEVVMCIPL